MAQGKRTDVKTRARVIKKKLENPDISDRDIAKEEGLSNHHVSSIINGIPDDLLTTSHTEAKSEALGDVLDSIISQGNEIINEYMPLLKTTIERYSDLKQISDIQEKAWKQQQIIGGKPTDRVAHDFSQYSDEELTRLINNKLSTDPSTL